MHAAYHPAPAPGRARGLIARVAAILALGVWLAAPAASAQGKGEKAAANQAGKKGKKGKKGQVEPSKHRFILDRVVAVVDGAVVLQSDLDIRMLPLLADLQSITDERERERRERKLRAQMLEEMISEELIVQAAKEAKLDVEDKEVVAAIEDIKKQNNLDDAGFEQALAMQGLTLDAYKNDVERQLLRHRSVNMLVRPRVTVTDEDVKARYDEMNRRSAAVSRIHLEHVLIALPAKPSEQQVAAAKEKAATIIQKAKDGAAFAELARQYSDDEATKAGGGDLGWIERGNLPTEWEVIVFAMDKGEVRGPISGPSGLHVFHVEDQERTEAKDFDAVKEQLRNELVRKEMDKQTRLWLEELRKEAFIDRKL